MTVSWKLASKLYVERPIMVMLGDRATARDEAETRKALGQTP